MKVNLPTKVRFGIYVFLGLGSILMSYLSAVGLVHAAEMTAWTMFSAFVGGLAAVNTDIQE